MKCFELIFLLVISLCIFLILPLHINAHDSAQQDQQDAQVKNSNASNNASKPPPSYRINGRVPFNLNPKYLVLTFDDGPHTKYHNKLVNILKKYDVPATFFMVAKNIEKFLRTGEFSKEMLENLLQSGQIIGSHSYHHHWLNKLSTEEIKEDFRMNNQIFENIIGKTPAFFREPYGASSYLSIEQEANHGYVVVHWGFDSSDWVCGNINNLNYTKEEILDQRIKCVHKYLLKYKLGTEHGGVMLFHENEWTIHAIEDFIITAREQGYRFVPLTYFLTEEMRKYIWNYYDCDKMKSWKDLYYTLCHQIISANFELRNSEIIDKQNEFNEFKENNKIVNNFYEEMKFTKEIISSNDQVNSITDKKSSRSFEIHNNANNAVKYNDKLIDKINEKNIIDYSNPNDELKDYSIQNHNSEPIYEKYIEKIKHINTKKNNSFKIILIFIVNLIFLFIIFLITQYLKSRRVKIKSRV